MVVARMLFTCAYLVFLGVAASQTASMTDLRRARTKVPGAHVMGDGHHGMVLKLNKQLQATSGLKLRPCENFTVQELVNVQRALHAKIDPLLNDIYQKSSDNRQLAAFGTVANTIDDLERLWSEELALIKEHPNLHVLSRDAKCHETIMWFVHHLSQAQRSEMQELLTFPLLPARSQPYESVEFHGIAPTAVVDRVFAGYKGGLNCNVCHASGATQKNTESKVWPDELTYLATGHGAFPFWDNGGPGCSHCDPSVDNSAKLKVVLSATLNSEVLMHSACGDMSWTGSSSAPKSTPCNHLFTPDDGAFIYTPTAALEYEADGKFCCRSVSAGSSNFPGAVPKNWMRSMTYAGQKDGFSGEYYSGPVKIYTGTSAGLSFWYYEKPDGTPIEQGEGCYQPGVQKKEACDKMMPIMLWHDYDTANFKAVSGLTKANFTVPDVCKNTKLSCSIPGDDGPSPSPSPPSPSPPSPSPPSPSPSGQCGNCATLVKQYCGSKSGPQCMQCAANKGDPAWASKGCKINKACEPSVQKACDATEERQVVV